jgi:hypothetical protein
MIDQGYETVASARRASRRNIGEKCSHLQAGTVLWWDEPADRHQD